MHLSPTSKLGYLSFKRKQNDGSVYCVITIPCLTLARFCGTHWHDWSRASAQTSIKLA